MKALTVISWVNFAVLLLLAAISFRVSFFAQAELVVSLGLADTVAEGAFWPIAIDGSLVGMGLAGVRQSLTGGALLRPLRFGILVVSLVSVSLNALHAPPNALARSVAIIPPVLLVTFLEILLGQLRETVRKSEARPVAEGATHGTRVVPGDTSRVSRDTADVPSDTNHVPNVERLYHDDTRSVSQLEHLEQDEPTDVPGDTSDVPDDTKLEQPVSEDGTGLYHETGDVSRDTADDPSDTDDAPDLFQGEHLPHPTGTPIGPDGELDLDFDDRREAILALRHQGLTFREIAEHVGVSHSTVSRTVRQHETEGGVS